MKSRLQNPIAFRKTCSRQTRDFTKSKTWKDTTGKPCPAWLILEPSINSVAQMILLCQGPSRRAQCAACRITQPTERGFRTWARRLSKQCQNRDLRSRTLHIADISRPPTSVGEFADAGDIVMCGQNGGSFLIVTSGERLDFKRMRGCALASHLVPGTRFWFAG